MSETTTTTPATKTDRPVYLQVNGTATAYEVAPVSQVNGHGTTMRAPKAITNITIFGDGEEIISTGTGYLSATGQFQTCDILDELELYERRSDTALNLRSSYFRDGTLFLYIKDARKFQQLPSKIIRQTDYEVFSGESFSIKCEIDNEYGTFTIPSASSISEYTELGKLVRAKQLDLESIIGFPLSFEQYSSMLDNADSLLCHFEELVRNISKAKQ